MTESLAGKKILLAEDNSINAVIISRYLKKWGIDVDVAVNGQVCVDKAIANRYDLILMDMQMPEMDGIEATREIRKSDDPYLQNIPIIALTANSESDVVITVKNAGMDDLIPKPFNPDELRSKLLNKIG